MNWRERERKKRELVVELQSLFRDSYGIDMSFDGAGR
jgi:hypothetical protein